MWISSLGWLKPYLTLPFPVYCSCLRPNTGSPNSICVYPSRIINLILSPPPSPISNSYKYSWASCGPALVVKFSKMASTTVIHDPSGDIDLSIYTEDERTTILSVLEKAKVYPRIPVLLKPLKPFPLIFFSRVFSSPDFVLKLTEPCYNF